MGKIILIRHGKASFGKSDYDQLSDMGKYQAQVTGQYLRHAKITPTAIYSGTMKRQIETAEIAKKSGSLNIPVTINPFFDEYDYQAIIQSHLDDLIASDPTVSEDIDKAFNDLYAFRRIFSKLLERWISGKYDKDGYETFKSYIQRVHQGIDLIRHQRENDIVLVFTSGGFISVSMHLIQGLPPEEALKLGWKIYNCSVTSFFCIKKEYQLDMFNSAGHLEMDQTEGILTYI
jgi:broad specificity phosphatase PhoE